MFIEIRNGEDKVLINTNHIVWVEKVDKRQSKIVTNVGVIYSTQDFSTIREHLYRTEAEHHDEIIKR